MKTFFTTFFALLFCLQVNAQVSDSVSYKPVAIYYNADYKVTKKEQAVYARVAYFPEKLVSFQNFESPQFNGPIKDYYADGTLWAAGNYNNGKPVGVWSFYYPNGQLDGRGSYDGNMADGKWEFWWPNGQPLMVAEFKGSKQRIISFWTEAGEQTVKDGNGVYTSITTNEEGKQMKMQGAYKDGYQYGRWTYGPVDGEVLVEQTFNHEGRVLVAISYEGKRKKTYFGNRLSVRPEPTHLPTMAIWERDANVYDSSYPLLADVMGFGVQRINLEKNKKATTDHYYKIYQEHATGADTLMFGLPITMPDFGKNMSSFLNRNVRYPQQLKNQNINGQILVGFDIKVDGSIQNPTIMKGLHPELDEEVLRVFKMMPKGKPATQNGVPIDIRTTFSLKFKQSAVAGGAPE